MKKKFLRFGFRSRYISRYASSKFDFFAFCSRYNSRYGSDSGGIARQQEISGGGFHFICFSTRRFSPPNRIGAQISKILS